MAAVSERAREKDHDVAVALEESRRHAHEAREALRRTHFTTEKICLVLLTLLAVFYTLYFAADIVLPFVFAFVLGLVLTPAATFMHRRLRFPRMLASLLLIVALFSAIGGIGYAISVPAAGWIAKAPESLPTLQQKLGFLRRPVDMFENGLGQVQRLMHPGGGSVGAQGGQHQPPSPSAPPQAQSRQQVTLSQGANVGLSVLAGTRAFLSEVFTLVIVLFFLLADGDQLLRRFVEILPGLEEKKRAVQIASEIEHNIAAYLATITVMNLLVGTLNGLSVWAWGLPNPLLWGVAAFLLNYVPILGPITGMVIFFFVGLFTFSSPLWALAPVGVYLLIHLAEGETITPMLLARRFTLNPLLVIAGLMFWDWLWGIPGALLAVPLLAVTKIICDHVDSLTPLGHLLGATPTRGRAAAAG